MTPEVRPAIVCREEPPTELDQGAGCKTYQNLRDREPESEDGLTKRLESQENRGDVQARVAQAGQDNRIFAASDAD